MKIGLGFLMLVALAACTDDPSALAPVVEGPWHSMQPMPKRYRVQAGDTLYSIAFRYDQDYRRLAAMNHLHSPYVVKLGQFISLKPPSSGPGTSFTPMLSLVPQPSRRQGSRLINYELHDTPAPKHSHWLWPTRGRIIADFAPELGKKGIDIAGSRNQTIRATASGWVAYAGDGLPGYGNMILIQHPHQVLSAYGYNARNLVHAGQSIRAGQAIAIMGTGPQHRYATHFELRKAGKPINPKYFLQY